MIGYDAVLEEPTDAPGRARQRSNSGPKQGVEAMKLIAAVLASLTGISGVAFASDPLGRMEFPNKYGTVVFYHKKHVSLVQGDCKVCHERPGLIENFGKAFAHRLCIGCHEPQAGKMEGPITCEGCHSSS
jgi:cytochrome c7-like protein